MPNKVSEYLQSLNSEWFDTAELIRASDITQPSGTSVLDSAGFRPSIAAIAEMANSLTDQIFSDSLMKLLSAMMVNDNGEMVDPNRTVFLDISLLAEYLAEMIHICTDLERGDELLLSAVALYRSSFPAGFPVMCDDSFISDEAGSKYVTGMIRSCESPTEMIRLVGLMSLLSRTERSVDMDAEMSLLDALRSVPEGTPLEWVPLLPETGVAVSEWLD